MSRLSDQVALVCVFHRLVAGKGFGNPALIDAEHCRDDVQRLPAVQQEARCLTLGLGQKLRAPDGDLIEFNPGFGVSERGQEGCSFLAAGTRQVATDRVGVCRAIHRGAGSRGGRAIVSRPSYRPLLCTVFPHKEVLGVKNHLSGGSRFVSTASGLPPFPRPAGRRGGASSSLRHRATPAMNPVTGGQSGLPVGLPRTLGAVFGRPHFSGVVA